ncbi:hypothetical protein PFTANZ_02713 [Plasmodium falciparum Tanzania (2000708)]|uniref:Plasmodium RESA N-terminal domain-containing protein n=1 Tax=Plasmodium falciparum Tanzania (2000708) TaxID=1036725 RepID=A0A024W6Q0_PLAFA|nr:hypothetical protein PFTANZ_02713 [Plasmodium falciparum Tanzania (2000708)]
MWFCNKFNDNTTKGLLDSNNNVCCSFESNEISKVNLIKKEYSRILSETEALENLKEESKNRKDDEEEVSLFDGSDDMGRTYDNDTCYQSRYNRSSIGDLIQVIKSTFGGEDEHLFQTCPDIFDELVKRSTWERLELDLYETEISDYLTVTYDLSLNEKILTLSRLSNEEDLYNLWSEIMRNEERKFSFLRYHLYNYYYSLKNRSRVSREYSEKIWNECEETLKSLHESHESSIFDLFHKWINGSIHELSEFKVLVSAGRYSWRNLLKTGERECKKFMIKHYKGKTALRI